MKLKIQKIIPSTPIANSTNTLLSLIQPLLKTLHSKEKNKTAKPRESKKPKIHSIPIVLTIQETNSNITNIIAI